ncbi:C2 domain-containing protein 5 [Armadillidium vulgare]|nr:C2 domain-containing protein 5 [Armadillidium vulgare]
MFGFYIKVGQGCLIQARVVRSKRDLKGELNAKEISDSLPFLEYELHKQLYQKIMFSFLFLELS